MKKKDLLFAGCCAAALAPFFLFPGVLKFYLDFNAAHGMIMSSVKFAVLATLGEVIGLRIKTGNYRQKGFGVLPRAIVWGFIGLPIKASFIVFSTGTLAFVHYLGLPVSEEVLNAAGFSFLKLVSAFSVSASMNIVFAPLMMTFHQLLDMHIAATGGTLKGFFTPFKIREHFIGLDWKVQWDFVFMKTIPLFWIPAHTVTFLLPEQHRVLFAAVLGVLLGIFLAVASNKGKSKSKMPVCDKDQADS